MSGRFGKIALDAASIGGTSAESELSESDRDRLRDVFALSKSKSLEKLLDEARITDPKKRKIAAQYLRDLDRR